VRYKTRGTFGGLYRIGWGMSSLSVTYISYGTTFLPTRGRHSLQRKPPPVPSSLSCVCVDRVSGLVAPLSSVTYTTLCASTSAQVGRTTNQICLWFVPLGSLSLSHSCVVEVTIETGRSSPVVRYQSFGQKVGLERSIVSTFPPHTHTHTLP
jgi:hypothetical protein